MDKVIYIGYGHDGLIASDENYIEIELYYGDVVFNKSDANVILDNWNDDSFLYLFDSTNVFIWYEDNQLIFEDGDGCGFECTKERFIELFSLS